MQKFICIDIRTAVPEFVSAFTSFVCHQRNSAAHNTFVTVASLFTAACLQGAV
jgi:hypothetical protein